MHKKTSLSTSIRRKKTQRTTARRCHAGIFLCVAQLLAVWAAGAESALHHLDFNHIKQTSQPIHLDVSYFIDEQSYYNYWNLPKDAFKAAKADFNPGFHEGILWIDIAFREPPQNGIHYTLDFGSDGIEVAEAFIQSGGKWEFFGRTSRILPGEQVSTPSIRQKIPVSTLKFDDEEVHTIRVKVLSHFGSTIALRMQPSRTAERNVLGFSILHAMSAILVLSTTVLLIIFALALKDPAIGLLAGASFVFVLFMAQITGAGPVFVWNDIAARTQAPQIISYTLIYILISIFAAFFFCIKKVRHIRYAIPWDSISLNIVLVLTTSGFLLLVAGAPPAISARMFSASVVGSALCFAAITSVKFFRKSSSLPEAINWWTPVLLCIAAAQTIRVLKAEGCFPPQLFNDKSQLTYYILFLFLVVPPVTAASKKQSRKFRKIKEQLALAEKENIKLQHNTSFLYAATDELQNKNNVILNSIRMPVFSTGIPDMQESKLLIETSAACSVDLLLLLRLQQGCRPTTSPVIIREFLDGCIAPAAQFARQKDISIQTKTTVSDGTIIVCSPHILELLLTNLLMTVIKKTPATSTLSCELQLEGLNLSVKVRSHSPHNESSLPPDNHQHFAIVERLCELNSGAFIVQPHNDGYEYSARILCDAVPDSGSGGRRYAAPLYTLPGMESYIPAQDDEKLSAALRSCSVLIADSSERNNIYYRKLLCGYCTVSTVSDGIEAWKYLGGSPSALPDVLLLEHSLEPISGMELYRRCCATPALQGIPVIMLLRAEERGKKSEYMGMGAAGCLVKPFTAEDLLYAIRSVISVRDRAKLAIISQLNTAVSSGSSPDISDKIHAPSGMEGKIAEKLSQREQQIAVLISEGKSDKEIAEALHISPATVSTHNKRLFKKLGVHSRVELMGKVR